MPAAWHRDGRAAKLAIGTMVRVALQGRRVGAWVTACDPEPTPWQLRPLSKLVGVGPSAELVDLARWAAWRWAGRRATFLRTASPHRVVESVPDLGPRREVPPPRATSSGAGEATFWAAAFDCAVSVVRIPPAGDRGPLLAAACSAATFCWSPRTSPRRLAWRNGCAVAASPRLCCPMAGRRRQPAGWWSGREPRSSARCPGLGRSSCSTSTRRRWSPRTLRRGAPARSPSSGPAGGRPVRAGLADSHSGGAGNGDGRASGTAAPPRAGGVAEPGSGGST